MTKPPLRVVEPPAKPKKLKRVSHRKRRDAAADELVNPAAYGAAVDDIIQRTGAGYFRSPINAKMRADLRSDLLWAWDLYLGLRKPETEPTKTLIIKELAQVQSALRKFAAAIDRGREAGEPVGAIASDAIFQRVAEAGERWADAIEDLAETDGGRDAQLRADQPFRELRTISVIDGDDPPVGGVLPQPSGYRRDHGARDYLIRLAEAACIVEGWAQEALASAKAQPSTPRDLPADVFLIGGLLPAIFEKYARPAGVSRTADQTADGPWLRFATAVVHWYVTVDSLGRHGSKGRAVPRIREIAAETIVKHRTECNSAGVAEMLRGEEWLRVRGRLV